MKGGVILLPTGLGGCQWCQEAQHGRLDLQDAGMPGRWSWAVRWHGGELER
jgi:hypothetical protein